MQALLQEKAARPRLHWVVHPSDHVGNALGYATHNRYMMESSRNYIELDSQAEIALHIVSADWYRPFEGRYNVLFTMWEFLDLPDSYIRAVEKADALIVPSKFCRDLFSRYTDKPIYYCPEGVDEKTYSYFQRPQQPARFRFLWVGAPNPRKGYPIVLEMIKVFEHIPYVEIYLKTTMPKMNFAETLDACLKNWDDITKEKGKMLSLERMMDRLPRPELADTVRTFGRYNNIIFDTRKLSVAELVALYNSASCFVLPSLGEGWGLTLIEAMATGCPCIAPVHTGIADFFDHKVGFPLNYRIVDFDLDNYSLKTKGFIPDTEDCLRRMIEVIENYPYALRKGRRASEHVRFFFTWDRAGKRLASIINQIQEKLN